MDASTLRDTSLENELAYLTKALKNLEVRTAKQECRANSVKAQFRMQKLKERLQTRPPSKSTITEIITTEMVEGREVETKHNAMKSTNSDRGLLQRVVQKKRIQGYSQRCTRILR